MSWCGGGQLLNVLPAQSGPFLPEPYRELMTQVRLRTLHAREDPVTLTSLSTGTLTLTLTLPLTLPSQPFWCLNPGVEPSASVLPLGLRDRPQRQAGRTIGQPKVTSHTNADP